MHDKRSVFLKYFPNGNTQDRFLLIFRHNTQIKDWFTTEEEFKFANSLHKYSIFGYINDDFKVSGVFEFIMEYPEISMYGHWTQKLNPLYAANNSDVGAEEKGSTWDAEVSFNGLRISERQESCYLDGTDEYDQNNHYYRWYYAIGMKTSWSQNIMPAFYYNSDKFSFHEVLLWIRIEDLSLIKRIQFGYTCGCKRFSLNGIAKFILVFFFF